MKAVVCVQQCFDTEASIGLDDAGIVADDVTMVMNPYDEVAVEFAVQMLEAGVFDRLVAVSVGDEQVEDVLRTALAMGVDQAVRVDAGVNLDEAARASLLEQAMRAIRPDIVLCGHVSSNDGSSQVPVRMAELLGVPHASSVAHMDISDDMVTCACETDDGVEVARLSLPAVVAVQVRIAEPRFVSMRNIVQAKRKPLGVMEGCAPAPAVLTLRYAYPQARRSVIMLEGDVREQVASLVREIRVVQDEKVI